MRPNKWSITCYGKTSWNIHQRINCMRYKPFLRCKKNVLKNDHLMFPHYIASGIKSINELMNEVISLVTAHVGTLEKMLGNTVVQYSWYQRSHLRWNSLSITPLWFSGMQLNICWLMCWFIRASGLIPRDLLHLTLEVLVMTIHTPQHF